MILVVLLGLWFVIDLGKSIRDIRASSKATSAKIYAGEAFFSWMKRTNGCPMHSTEGRALLLAYIEAYTRFLETHRFTDVEFESYLESLQDQLFTCYCSRHPITQKRLPPKVAAFKFIA
ncbi:MAG: hypothetical protein ACREGC_01635 [Minisyncoccia bacterium]